MLKKALATGAVLVLTACSGAQVDTDEVEKTIADNAENDLGGDVTVDCPDHVTWKAGETFFCEVAGVKGASGATVRMKDDEGAYAYKLEPATE